jgi:adenylate cyclase
LQQGQRRLAAILAADVAGYSRLMAANEAGTLARLKSLRSEIIDPGIGKFHGNIVGSAGDSLLIEFASAVNAVQCAVELQDALSQRNAELPEDERMLFRMGVNLGDVIAGDGTIHGDGVNIAARLEKMADPGGVCVGHAIHDQVRGKLPYAFSDLGEQRFHNILDPVRAYRVSTTASPGAPVTKSPRSDTLLKDKPSIAVLPFTNMSGDPEQEYFSDGITEDIITGLSRFRSVLVIARNSSFHYKGRSPNIPQAGRELGAQYVVEGSVRKAGNRVRVTAQLIDARSGSHLWAERFDRDLKDIFAVQDELTERIVATVANRLERSELDRAIRKPPEAMQAYDYVLRARAIISDSRDANRRSRALYEQALALDPNNIRALIGMAWTHSIDWASRWSDSGEDSLDRAQDLARSAFALDNGDYRVHLLLGHLQVQRKRYATALDHFQTAMALNSNDADGAAQMGGLLISMGRFPEALESFDRAVRLNPLHPAWYLYEIGEAHYCARQYEQAIAPLQAAINRFPNYITPRRHLAAAFAQLGRLDEARTEIATIRRLDPSLSLSLYRNRLSFEKSEDLEHYLDGLRKAGLPE